MNFTIINIVSSGLNRQILANINNTILNRKKNQQGVPEKNGTHIY